MMDRVPPSQRNILPSLIGNSDVEVKILDFTFATLSPSQKVT